MTAPAQDWAEKARGLLKKLGLTYPLGVREKEVEIVAVALSGAAGGRESLAQEIREGLRKRGLWSPTAPSDLISAIFRAIDDAARTGREELLEIISDMMSISSVRGQLTFSLEQRAYRALRGAQEGETEQAGYFTHPGYDPSVQSGVKEKK